MANPLDGIDYTRDGRMLAMAGLKKAERQECDRGHCYVLQRDAALRPRSTPVSQEEFDGWVGKDKEWRTNYSGEGVSFFRRRLTEPNSEQAAAPTLNLR